VTSIKYSSFLIVILAIGTGVFLLVGIFLTFPEQASDDQVMAAQSPVMNMTPAPVVTKNEEPAPELTAKGVMIVDAPSGAVLYEKNAYDPLYPASTTKLMTALVVIDEYALDDVVVVPPLTVDGQKMRLYTGEQISIESLLYGMLVASANDAAEVLAHVHPEGRSYFISAMNKKADELQLIGTHFENPSGLDDIEQYTTAEDLLKIGLAVMNTPELARIVGTKEATVFSSSSNGGRHMFSNINSLLGTIPGVKGIKTGWTEIAGENLLTAVDRDGREIMIALLASEDRFGETKQLVEWVYRVHEWNNY